MRKEEDQQHRDNDKGLKMGSRSTLIELAVIDAGEVGRRTLSRWFFWQERSSWLEKVGGAAWSRRWFSAHVDSRRKE